MRMAGRQVLHPKFGAGTVIAQFQGKGTVLVVFGRSQSVREFPMDHLIKGPPFNSQEEADKWMECQSGESR